VAVIGGQPTKLLVDMKPEARQYVKLLKLDPDQPASELALRIYFPATVRASSYPNLLTETCPASAVKAFLVTYDYNLKQTKDVLTRFARSLCENFPTLQDKGHPKWREVTLGLAGPRPRMVLLPTHGQRAARVHRPADRQQGAAGPAMPATGARTRSV
jgi:hypothetical protein